MNSSKNNVKLSKKQDKNLRIGKYYLPAYFPHKRSRKKHQNHRLPVPPPEFINNPRYFLKNYVPETALCVYGQVILYIKKFKCAFPSQEQIGNDLGISREEVNRNLAILETYHLIGRIYRHMNTCIYFLPRVLVSERLIKKISSLVPALLIGASLYLTQSIKSFPFNHSLFINKPFSHSHYNVVRENELNGSLKQGNRDHFLQQDTQVPISILSQRGNLKKESKSLYNEQTYRDVDNHSSLQKNTTTCILVRKRCEEEQVAQNNEKVTIRESLDRAQPETLADVFRCLGFCVEDTF